MKPLSVTVTDIKYRRPGKSLVEFLADYEGYVRRGTVIFDVVNQKFLTHTKDLELLAALCMSLCAPRQSKNIK